jgi:hypothetical protein
VLAQARPVEEAEDGIGVADVDREQHGASLLALSRRPGIALYRPNCERRSQVRAATALIVVPAVRLITVAATAGFARRRHLRPDPPEDGMKQGLRWLDARSFA